MSSTKDRFFVLRVSVLLLVFAGVLLYAAKDLLHRRARNQWLQPLRVGVVFLQPEIKAPIESGSLELLNERLQALGNHLSAEFERYHPGSRRMLLFKGYGRVSVSQGPPELRSESVTELLRYTYAMWRYSSRINQVAGIPSDQIDSMIYVMVDPITDQQLRHVEGYSQQGGHIGVARIQLDATTVDLCLFVVAHELMHTLGASDKYGPDGRTSIPEGLGDPAQQPLYPQRFAEVMARNRVLSEQQEAVPESLVELRVGNETAREIGWLR